MDGALLWVSDECNYNSVAYKIKAGYLFGRLVVCTWNRFFSSSQSAIKVSRNESEEEIRARAQARRRRRSWNWNTRSRVEHFSELTRKRLIISFLTTNSNYFLTNSLIATAPGNSHIYSILASQHSSSTIHWRWSKSDIECTSRAGCVLSRIKAIHSRRSSIDDGWLWPERKLNVRINSWFAVEGDSNLRCDRSMMSRSKTDIWLYLFYSL